MEVECSDLNKRFFKYHKHKRPYIILKWAESKDGFISPLKSNRSPRKVNWISGEDSKKLTHKWRSEEHSILVGVQTVIDDNPLLTSRFVDGKNPIRLVLDPNSRIPIDSKVLSETSKTIILSKKENNLIPDYTKSLSFENIQQIIESLHDMKIQSVLIEGGTKTINHFLNNDLWDSIRVFKSNKNIKSGIKSPNVDFLKFSKSQVGNDILYEVNR